MHTRCITGYNDAWYPVSAAADECDTPPSIVPYERLSCDEAIGCAVIGPSVVPAAAASCDKSSMSSSFCDKYNNYDTSQKNCTAPL